MLLSPNCYEIYCFIKIPQISNHSKQDNLDIISDNISHSIQSINTQIAKKIPLPLMSISSVDPEKCYAQRNKLYALYANFPAYQRPKPNTLQQIKDFLDGKKNASFPSKTDLFDIAFQISQLFLNNWHSKNFISTFQKSAEQCENFDLEFVKELELEEWETPAKLLQLFQKIFSLFANGLIVNFECFEAVFGILNVFLEGEIEKIKAEVGQIQLTVDVQKVCDLLVFVRANSLKFIFGEGFKYPAQKFNEVEIEKSEEEICILYRKFVTYSQVLNQQIQIFGKSVQIAQNSGQAAKYYALKKSMEGFQKAFRLDGFGFISIQKEAGKKQVSVNKKVIKDVIINFGDFEKMKIKGFQNTFSLDKFFKFEEILVVYEEDEGIIEEIEAFKIKYDEIKFNDFYRQLIQIISETESELEVQILAYCLVQKYINNGFTQIQIVFSISECFQYNFFDLCERNYQFFKFLLYNNLPIIQIRGLRLKDFEKSTNKFNFLFKDQINYLLENKFENKKFKILVNNLPIMIQNQLIKDDDLKSIVNGIMSKVLEIQITNNQLQDTGLFAIYCNYCIALKQYLDPQIKLKYETQCDDICVKHPEFKEKLHNLKYQFQ